MKREEREVDVVSVHREKMQWISATVLHDCSDAQLRERRVVDVAVRPGVGRYRCGNLAMHRLRVVACSDNVPLSFLMGLSHRHDHCSIHCLVLTRLVVKKGRDYSVLDER